MRVKSITLDSTLLDIERNQFVVQLDTLSILQETFTLSGLESQDYSINYLTSQLLINHDYALLGRTITCRYRVFMFNFAANKHHRELSQISSKSNAYKPHVIPIDVYRQFMQEESKLQANGLISRGFMMGNNQDLVLNSTLNLQLTGYLTDSLEISANITDSNIPIQPEGNSRQIQDFDKIFIRINYKDKYFLDAGDLDINERKSYYMINNKRLLGMNFLSKQTLKNNNTLINEVGGGVNKGSYVRQTFNVINGVLGPYILTGKNNEQHIVILSGTEKIYLDGKLLVRGKENDYVIDYNLGEVTFTSRVLVTSEKRFMIEFEYRNNYYAHYTLYTFNEWQHEKHGKLKLTANFFHEQDLKNRAIQPELDNEQKRFLSRLGDKIEEALYPMADSLPFNANEILYEKIDTIVLGVVFQIYKYSTNSNVQLYRLGFSMTGYHRGNYILSKTIANGRVFEWVAPQNGISQGNYEPVMLLATPELVELAMISADYKFSDHFSIKSELAISNHDVNTFSELDDGDNVGFAVKVGIAQQNKLHKSEKESDWWFKTNLDYEFAHRNFYTTESYREVEFARNYNLAEDKTNRFHEQMLQLHTG
ncbi:MAG: hypothetical protein LBU51_05275, partial [Bacteroidales bacterium]|nr:hypothetical protein [Bacteroidales bacterium]